MRRWLITGAAGGLGSAIADAALAQGDQVVGTVRQGAAAFAARAPGHAHAITLDLTDSGAIPKAVEQAAQQMDGIDIVVNNAGYCLAGAVEEIADTEAAQLFTVNVLAPLAIMRSALPFLRAASRGRIINISSMAAIEGYPGLGAYCASKAALSALTDVLAIEAAAFGIGVTAIEAGGMRTDFAGSSLRMAAQTQPEYHAMRSTLEAGFALSNGKQVNDPVQIAEAILDVATMPAPPTRIVLGEGARDRAISALEKRIILYST